MEYERIHKPQNGAGIISPSKLRAKLMGMGVTQQKKKKKEGSNSNSSRTSPSSSRLEDSQFVNDSLLDVASASIDNNIDSAVSLELPQTLREQEVSSSVPPQNHLPPRENMEPGHGYGHGHSHGRFKTQPPTRSDSGNSSAVHPLKSIDDENLDYDSNASSSSFEFHKGERMAHRSLTRSLSRPTSYKWNDAEKWIMSKQTGQGNHSKTLGKTGGNRLTGVNMVRVVPEADHPHSRMPEMKRVDNCQPTGHMNLDRFILDHPQSSDPREVSNMNNSTHEVPGTPGIQAISMRDMGTEMTPVTSLEPSRTATPNGSLTPYRSPISSIPSTPRAGEPTTAPAEHTTESNAHYLTGKGNQELSEHELKLKTRREIVALGVQLGKMNIAAWASKDEKDKYPFPDTHPEELKRIEFEKRAAAWEEAEKSKHAARYKREEIKIQAWESQQKVKLEEELRRIEAKVERLRTQSQAKMMKKIAMAREKSEQKRAAAEAQKARDAEKTAAQAEFIRQTGRAPYSDNLCCGLLC